MHDTGTHDTGTTHDAGKPTGPVWDPQQYLRHSGPRTRPFHDLLARIPEPPARGRPVRIADLGCGAGNATKLLAGRWPDARITGYDNSPAMLRAARTHLAKEPYGGHVDFVHADIADWTPGEPFDLIVSNAALQWVPGHARLFPSWVRALTPGGSLAVQVPGNGDAPSHVLLRELCASARWRDRLHEAGRRTVDVLQPGEYLERLMDLGCTVDAWETTYVHVLTGEDPVLDWIRGTGLRPVLTALAGDPAAEAAFLDAYRALLREAYPPRPDGTLFPFRRVFAVARTAG
ncbi:trans-aconitate 2-methyltransferase [Streptomyces cinnamoneus]|uniref:Trans-aconitate 2-methyltransferase n=1 Tax=Streptomyces cinnamoneus TaxID=53446 RepID=A0A918WMK7_STRCJ|nr:trans-aconitate 2-methyltransferase [Streptomyces cinnamoneus]GHC64243.1 trans-aconitate 2-methyltransferase [Streptomyces cinnamoneus]